jgi:hypothetical protein
MRSARLPALEPDLLPPPPERGQHGRIVRLDRQIADAAGNIGVPFLAISLLSRMHASGRISLDEARAGEQFHAHFRRAALGDLRAADLARIRGQPRAGRAIAPSAEHYRRKVWDAVMALGGPDAPCGSIIWAVIGEEMDIKRWALERFRPLRRVSEHAASGILIAALGCLATYYERGRR